jgi:Putative zinc-finger
MAGPIKERSNIPASPACGQWETLLADAMDGQLRPEDEAVFTSHMASCAACSEMFEQVRRGREWLEFLAPEPEVPAYLLDRILGETGHGKPEPGRFVAATPALAGGPNVIAMPPVWQRPGFGARMRRFAEPRLMMTAAMAFFSIALTLSLTGVRFSAVSMNDLRPSAVRSVVERRIMTASTPFIRYYDHLRFVYEVESTMKEMRRNSESQSQQKNERKTPAGEGETHKKDGGSKLNPNEAPQQTVNPPDQLWGANMLEARYQLPSRIRQHSEAKTKGESTLTEDTRASVLAMPERRTSCLA